ncbi:cell differentiation protein RCD1-like isoform X1 [Populus alba x Populus x berolinensis]|uniref:Cell differentiation protein RCD1-like isoform X1 n=1 Tax=Populus alba x Populus x berolinensis TaxID=444605 RepID=A0AAD6LTZ8_9ROSI|nr:cell differentiation protein RCD1-like isoform X1 [Populus alba x Populus x berolinensis]
MYRWPELQFGSWNPSEVAYRARETDSVVQLIEALNNDATRECALHLLSKNRAIREEMAPLLWYSVGTISILLQEIISVYHSLHSPIPMLTDRVSNRVCDALVLFEVETANYKVVPFILYSRCIVSSFVASELTFMFSLTCRIVVQCGEFLSIHYWFQPNDIFGGDQAYGFEHSDFPPATCQPTQTKLPLYLYPLLNNTNKERPHQFLRLASLSVIGALAKVDDPNVINFLLESEVFPCCIRSMEVGDVLSKTVATYIVYKILINEEGLRYCCTVAERFFALVRVLGSMVLKLAEEGQLAENPSIRLLKHIIWCYHRLSESPRSCDGLRFFLPVILSDAAFIDIFRGDPSAVPHLQQLFHNVSNRTSRIQTIETMIRPLVKG